MSQVTIVGCDLHDRSMLIRTAIGKKEPEQKSFVNDFEGRSKMIEYLIQFAQKHHSARIVFVYEASGQGYGLYDLLSMQGIECYVLSPTHLPKTAKSKKNKTDAKDAQMLLEQVRGYVLAGNKLPIVWTPPQALRDDRELVRARLETAEASTRVKLKILAMLKRYNRSLPVWFQKNRSWTKRFVAWLREEAEGLVKTVMPVLQSLIERFETFRSQITTLDRHIRHLSKTPRYQAAADKLFKMSGVGPLTAMVFLTEMGDLGRFSNRREVAAYLGLCPSSHESGEANDRKGHITRQGPSRLRKVLCQAAWAAVRHDAKQRATWERIKGDKKGRGKKAIVAIMRRMAICMWHEALSMGVDVSLTQVPHPTPTWLEHDQAA